MSAEQQKTKGNACFRRKVPTCRRRRLPPLPPLAASLAAPHPCLPSSHCLQDYDAAAEHYSAALRLLDGSSAADATPLRLALLTNRSLALHRLGRYAAAAADAEAALQLDPASTKAAFRAAAAHLMAGNGAATAQHAQALVMCGSPAGGTTCEAPSQPAAWAALARHATALAAHQQRLANAQQAAAAVPDVGELLEALAAEAEGEGDAAGGPAALLHRLAALLGADGGQQASSSRHSSGSSTGSDAEKAAVALEAHPQGFTLLLFFLADPDPAAQQAAVAALQAAGCAAAGGSTAAVLWPSQVWQRLAALGTDAAGGELQASALRVLSWAAGQDPWVREQLLLHPLPAPAGTSPASAAPPGSPAITAQVAGMLAQPATLHNMAPAAVQAAAELLRQYATDAAAAEALAQLGCRPLLALLHAARQAEGMAAFRAPEQDGDADAAAAGTNGDEVCAPGRDSSASSRAGAGSAASPADAEQEALEALRSKLRKVFIADLVALQRCLLSAACRLAVASRELLLSEAVVEQGSSSSGSGGKRGVGAGPFLTGGQSGCWWICPCCCIGRAACGEASHQPRCPCVDTGWWLAYKDVASDATPCSELLELARELHGQQPRRTAPVLGPDGNPKAYAKRR